MSSDRIAEGAMPSAHDADAAKMRTASATDSNNPQHPERSDDLEFSDFGRDPRYPPVWWLLPILVVGGIVAVVLIVRFVL